MKLAALFLCCLAVLSSGCATPRTKGVEVSDVAIREEAEKERDWAVRSIVEEQHRLARVYWRLARGGQRLCGHDVSAGAGVVFSAKNSSKLSAAYGKVFGITERPTVLFTVEGAPADRAGLRARDVLTRMNGIEIASMSQLDEAYKTLRAGVTAKWQVIRDGAAVTLELTPERTCSYPAQLSPSLLPNAFADGARIVVTRGMMAFVKDDAELAMVLAHELAHNAMHHMDAKKQNALGDFFGQIFSVITPGSDSAYSAGAASYSQEFEAEADYVGLYLLAAAGMPFCDASRFWRRMAAVNPANIEADAASTHVSIPYRMLALEATIKEIDGKLERGEPLEPNMKHGQDAVAPIARQ